MELSFDSREIRAYCEHGDSAREKFGLEHSISLRSAIAELWVASGISDIPLGSERLSIGEHPETLRLMYSNGITIEFVSNHVQAPVDSEGSIDWLSVSSIKIIGIEVNSSESN